MTTTHDYLGEMLAAAKARRARLGLTAVQAGAIRRPVEPANTAGKCAESAIYVEPRVKVNAAPIAVSPEAVPSEPDPGRDWFDRNGKPVGAARDALSGCSLPPRFRLLILPILMETGLTWALVCPERPTVGFRESRRSAARRRIFGELFEAGLGYSKIARYAHVDHSTVIYAVRMHRAARAQAAAIGAAP